VTHPTDFAGMARAAARKAELASASHLPIRFYDPWEEWPLPPWPGGTLSRQTEETIALMALRDGVDFSAQAMIYIAAASGAAPKNARFAPYQKSLWAVPPIVWMMLLAMSGQRKTQLLDNAFRSLRKLHGGPWAEYMVELDRWNALPEDEKRAGGKPRRPHSYIIDNASLQALQHVLAATQRGTLYLKDELAGFLDFGRFSSGNGADERSFFVDAYEDKMDTSLRIGRDDRYIQHTGITVFGCMQPARLASLKGLELESDGLLQRFITVRPAKPAVSRPDIEAPGQELIDKAIERIAILNGKRYFTDPDGSAIIHETERDGSEFAAITEFGIGFQGFCGKLHGTHARLALVLHMLERPDEEQIPAATVHRAARLTMEFILPHTRDFYATTPSANFTITRDIAGWLLTKAEPRVRASDITSGVASCKGMGLKRLQEVLDPLVTGGWLEPEQDSPANRAWMLNAELKPAFASRSKAEAERRAATRALLRRIGDDRN
jgi:hypothetical protein